MAIVFICLIPKVALSHSHLTDFVSTAPSPAPVLLVNPVEATEGEVIKLTCTSPVQASGFYFYEDFKLINEMDKNSNQTVFQRPAGHTGTYKYQCRYRVRIEGDNYYSRNSNTVTVSIKGKSVFRCLSS